jgi:hypothetical protein
VRRAPATREPVTRKGAKHPQSTPWTRPRLVATRLPKAPGRTGPRRAPFVLLVAGLLVGGLCALLALNTAAAAEELRRHNLTQANADMSGDVQQLQARLAARQAPAALAGAAAKLGMVPAGNPAFISIQADGTAKVLGDPQPAAAAPVPPPTTPTPKPTPKPTPHGTRTAVKSPTAQHRPTGTAKPDRTATPASKPTPTPTAAGRGAPPTTHAAGTAR